MSEPFYWFWVARDLDGGLWISTDDLVLVGRRWQHPMADITVRNVGLRWIRKLPPMLFPDLEKGQKRKVRLADERELS